MRAPVVKERVVVLDGVRTRALAVDGEGPPLLLLHGFSDSADTWRPLMLAAAEAGRRAVAVDLPGSGRAGPLPRTHVMEAFHGFTRAFVSRYADDDGAVLAGNSLGGLLSLRAAEDDAGPLIAIAPISPAGLAYHGRAKLLEGGGDTMVPLLRLAYRAPVPAPVVRGAARLMYRYPLGGSDELAKLYAGHFRGMHDVRRFGRMVRSLAAEMQKDPLRLERIGIPVLLIWGSKDMICDVAGAPAVLDAVADSRLVVLDDCGHCPQLQRPDDIARLIAGLPASAVPTPTARVGVRR